MSPSSPTLEFHRPSDLRATRWHGGHISGAAEIHVCAAHEEYRQAAGGCLTSETGCGRIVGACDGEIVAGRSNAVGEKAYLTHARMSVAACGQLQGGVRCHRHLAARRSKREREDEATKTPLVLIKPVLAIT